MTHAIISTAGRNPSWERSLTELNPERGDRVPNDSFTVIIF